MMRPLTAILAKYGATCALGKNDISSDDSRIKQRIAEAGQWFGETLLRDDALRESLNEHLEQAAHRVAPEFAAFLTRHISDTVKSWDARDMSRQIELNIGKDLQFIRINGTLVGDHRPVVVAVLADPLAAASAYWLAMILSEQ
jgi:uncharacterized membrane-anchored protein YjiN (DUF445 family)